ncbi:sugar synthetase [Methylacidiphilum kamchatkense Kam1]|uniref:Lipid-A-disaccharide synthase n=1 Tax=Methylacidiphilum kamchatkense Kam1 TaxID=1202785 RepID=A0A0C1UR00_9BACT|nr:lipid-A-disaccharide synthase [Methylacidiphilum kamchatkense]KIE58744.1 sugar synthetase [Methylacidiphilum kamchatkense Kam1]QDQ41858.1 lipid-A-disaccharide synthase [Methylacidiphilum kamchatkense Kam1]
MMQIKPSKKKFLLVAGETSGDLYGALLIEALRKSFPEAIFLGVGGSRMAAAGQIQLYELSKLAVVGLVEVIKNLAEIRRIFKELLHCAIVEKPDCVILIDYPGFNLRFASKLRKELPTTKIVYYISPQVWAWNSQRAARFDKLFDLMVVIFPFEKPWFEKNAPNLRVEWVGHPLLDRLLPNPLPNSQFSSHKISLLPGSRRMEIIRHLPILYQVAWKMVMKNPDYEFLWIAPNEELVELGLAHLGEKHLPEWLKIQIGYPLSHISRCRLAILASGSVSLECAILGVPQIVIYKTNPLTYQVGKRLVKVPFLSIVNVLASEQIVPEFVQDDAQPDKIVPVALRLMEDEEQRTWMKKRMKEVIDSLGSTGASQKTCNLIVDLLNEEKKEQPLHLRS